MSRDTYRFDDDTYTALAAADVPWQDALHVLRHARPRIRHHIGSVLRIAAQSRDGQRWLAVALIEDSRDDHYLVVGARWLDRHEAEQLRKLIERG